MILFISLAFLGVPGCVYHHELCWTYASQPLWGRNGGGIGGWERRGAAGRGEGEGGGKGGRAEGGAEEPPRRGEGGGRWQGYDDPIFVFSSCWGDLAC